jgi:cation diffusion facilitator family transporter
VVKSERDPAGRRVTLVGAAVNLALAGIKFGLGVVGRSQALIADALHSLSDLATDLVVLGGLFLGGRASDRDHPFGHRRLETVATMVVGLFLLFAAFEIGHDAYHHLGAPPKAGPNWWAVVGAGLSILIKEGLYRYTVLVGRKLHSRSVSANAWHHRTDALSSVAVLIGVGAGLINPAWRMLDAWAAILVAALVAVVGLQVIWGAFGELVDTAPRPEVLEHITACARGVTGVRGVHDLKVRSSGGRYRMEIHVVVDGELTVRQGHAIAKSVEQCLLDDVEAAEDVIVHVDPDGPEEPHQP